MSNRCHHHHHHPLSVRWCVWWLLLSVVCAHRTRWWGQQQENNHIGHAPYLDGGGGGGVYLPAAPPPPEGGAYLPDVRTPKDVMVDVINNMGLMLLEAHNEDNANNIALSPYGAASVLVALLEGLVGEAAYEIKSAVRLPLELSVVRVGLRDIHRHLKSYFIPKEGFLAGLTLSHDNITLSREYQSILRFYGYDVDSFNNPTYPETSTMAATTTATSAPETETTTMESISTIIERLTSTISLDMSMTTSTTPPTTQKTEEEEVTSVTTKLPVPGDEEVDGTTTKKLPARSYTTEMGVTTEKSSSPEVFYPMTTDMDVETDGTTFSTVTKEELKISTSSDEEKEEEEEDIEVNSIRIPTSTEGRTFFEATTLFEGTTYFATDGTTTTEDNEILAEDLNLTSTPSAPYTQTPNTEASSLEDQALFKRSTTTAPSTGNTSATMFEITANITTPPKPAGNRRKRSVIDYLIARYYDNYYINTNRRYLPYANTNKVHYSNYQPEEPYTFLVNGKFRETNISFMTYDTILPFYYIRALDAMALSFPLDSNMYYLLLVLPLEPTGIDKLIDEMRKASSLRAIVDRLEYTHVKAVIPSFMLKGYVILTPTLQKLCVRKIFEPRHANFSPMTPERDLYVTNIEQAVTVTIRNYVDPASHSARNLNHYRPVEFRADHPFLYFVMDSQIHVNLMAGKIINPLNSRVR